MTKALVVIDVQQGMFAIAEFQPHDGEAVVARIAELIAKARDAGAPVFFVQHDGGPGHVLAAGSAGFPFVASLTPRDSDVLVVKRQCNAFAKTDLDAKLAARGVDHLVVCGMQTEYCVDTAVRAAHDRGYRVTLVSDAHTTGDTAALKAKDIIAHHNRTLATFATLRAAGEIAFE